MTQYTKRQWQDEVKDQNGNIIQEGTPLSAGNFNRMEAGIDLGSNTMGAILVQALQEINAIKKERDKDANQRLIQGQATVTGNITDDMPSTYPFVLVSLPTTSYSQLNAPNYDVVLTVLSADDAGRIGQLTAFDKAQNGFKVQYTGTAKTVTFMWTLVNPNIR